MEIDPYKPVEKQPSQLAIVGDTDVDQPLAIDKETSVYDYDAEEARVAAEIATHMALAEKQAIERDNHIKQAAAGTDLAIMRGRVEDARLRAHNNKNSSFRGHDRYFKSLSKILDDMAGEELGHYRPEGQA